MPTNVTVLTRDTALAALADFFRETPFVFFGSGLSCGVDPCFGMGALQAALCTAIQTDSLSAPAGLEWETMKKALANGHDLESALDQVSSEELLTRVRSVTADHLVGRDREFSWKIASGEMEWPAARLIARMVSHRPRRR